MRDQLDEKNPNWKGNSVSYSGMHKWIARRKGKASECEMCKQNKKRYEWASKDGLYERDLTKWISLCSSCHGNYDSIYKKMWITRRLRIINSGNDKSV